VPIKPVTMKKLLPLLAFVLVGCHAIVIQVLFIREFMVVFFGNELCLGIILACWLMGIALGAASGGRIIKRTTDTFFPFAAYLIVICLLPFIQIFFIRLNHACRPNHPPRLSIWFGSAVFFAIFIRIIYFLTWFIIPEKPLKLPAYGYVLHAISAINAVPRPLNFHTSS